jgi:PncC family amidohydrolase
LIPTDGETHPGGSPAAEVLTLLRESGQTVSVAESCTGGWLAKVITDVPGASVVFWGGVTAYDDTAKNRLLDVDPGLLAEHGAVSREAVIAMASGVRRVARTDWAVAVTGIAGPTGGTPEKPVGTVWIAVDGPACASRSQIISGDRIQVRREAVEEALRTLRRQLLEAHG